MVVLDTHTLLWWLSDPNHLSAAANRAIKRTLDAKENLLISCISIWEIAMLIKKNRLTLNMDLESWLKELAYIDAVTFIPIDNEISIKSTLLPGEFHKDPADRMIVATARKFAIPLITKDEKVRNYQHVDTIW